MGASIRWTVRMRALLRRWQGAPLTWLIVGGFVLMAATAIGTGLTVDRFRQNAIESGRGDGPAIVFARRVSGPHGEFLGMVSRAIAPEQLESFFASTGLGEESSIAMHHQNGQLLARIPHVDDMIGQNYRTGSPEQKAVFERTFVTTQLASPIDGKDRIVASRLLTGEPLVIVATKSLDAMLATWRT